MPDTIHVGHLRGIVMRAPAMTATRDFYTRQWGLTEAARGDDTVYLAGSGSEPFLYGLKDGDTYGIEYAHFGMDTRADMDALFEQVTARGGTTLGEPALFDDPIGGYGFELLDPDNRRLRFTTDLAKRAAKQVHAYPHKMSHLVFNTPDLEGGEAWYTEVLGFKTSDYSADQMVFMRCNPVHHAVALVRGQYPAVNHVAFEVPGIDSFMRAVGRMKQNGQVPSWGPGRHGPGNNPFAYYVSPSGFVIEFTADVQQIDDATHQAKVWSRTDPEAMDQWMTAGPPTPAQRTVMAGRPDFGFPKGG
jgi:catechol 2,3-dioxygenase-like lactoylglutathione lyase family enzyme